MTETTVHYWNVGDKVVKRKGYKFPGTIVSRFYKLDGEMRLVVESSDIPGLLHIFAPEQMRKVS